MLLSISSSKLVPVFYTKVLVGICGTLSARSYQLDELHLNPEGARLFTSALAAFLPQTVDHEPAALQLKVGCTDFY